jgi:hypothetical protein
VSGDERASAADEVGGVPRLVTDGDLELIGLLPRSSNSTFLARATLGEEQTLVVYKPRRGETPLWDFPDGTLCRRETAAFVVARALGWPNIPPTVLRDGPAGEGSVQLFVEFEPQEHYFTLGDRMPDRFEEVALFDVVVNNADRKSGHCLLGKDGLLWVVDHGVCFSDEEKLRTVIWEFAGDQVPARLLSDLYRLRADIPIELTDLLAPEELGALRDRIDEVLAAGAYPEPGERRSFPWPPV